MNHHNELIPLSTDSELFPHQNSTHTVLARMYNPRFICSLNRLRLDFRQHNAGTPETDWFMNRAVNQWDVVILGDRWETDNMPRFESESGGAIGGPGTVGMIQARY